MVLTQSILEQSPPLHASTVTYLKNRMMLWNTSVLSILESFPTQLLLLAASLLRSRSGCASLSWLVPLQQVTVSDGEALSRRLAPPESMSTPAG